MALFNYECDEVKSIIDEVSPNYPQLTTYEKEWLFFHKYHYIPGVPVELEYEKVSVNPSGSVSNAIPFQYKNAILKGNTVVNLVGEKQFFTNNGTTTILKGWEFMLPYNLTKDKTYLAIFNATGTISDTNSKIYLIDNDFGNSTGNIKNPSIFKNGYNKVKCVATGDNHRILRIRTQVENYSQNFQVSDVMLIEYQDGMENWDIPYFEDTQSVQMPVLTTTGRNVFNEDLFLTYENIGYKKTSNGYTTTTVYFNSTYYPLQLKPNTTYYFDKTADSQGNTIISIKIGKTEYLTGNSGGFDNISHGLKTFTTDDTGLIHIRGGASGSGNVGQHYIEHMWIHEGENAIPYEPYKSNILTVNGDVILRSKGNICDELNLITGQLTQRIDEDGEVLSQEVVKTVAIQKLNKPYEGTNNYTLTSNIPCEAILEVPVVSSGKQTLEEINN